MIFSGPCDLSLATCMRSVDQLLPYTLVGEAFQKRLKTFADLFPPALRVPVSGFECSLQNEENWGDFHIGFEIPSQALLEIDQTIVFEDPSWRTTTALLQKWERSGYFVQKGIRRVILEFDVGSCPDWPPKPNLFFVFHPEAQDQTKTIAEAFLSLHHRPIPKALLSTLQPYSEEECFLSGVGFMLARPDCIRTTIQTQYTAIDSLVRLFPQPNLSGIFDSLIKFTEGSTDFSMTPFKFGIDLKEGGEISPKIGVYIHQKRELFSEKSLAPVLKKLFEKKLINQLKQEALLSWDGLRSEPYFDSPSDFLRVYSRRVNHLKFVCVPNRKLWVKAYLLFRCFVVNEPAYEKIKGP